MRTPDYIVTYEETPEWLTTGKRYVLEEDFDDNLFSVTSDKGERRIVHVPECAHLGWKKWKKGYIYYV